MGVGVGWITQAPCSHAHARDGRNLATTLPIRRRESEPRVQRAGCGASSHTLAPWPWRITCGCRHARNPHHTAARWAPRLCGAPALYAHLGRQLALHCPLLLALAAGGVGVGAPLVPLPAVLGAVLQVLGRGVGLRRKARQGLGMYMRSVLCVSLEGGMPMCGCGTLGDAAYTGLRCGCKGRCRCLLTSLVT